MENLCEPRKARHATFRLFIQPLNELLLWRLTAECLHPWHATTKMPATPVRSQDRQTESTGLLSFTADNILTHSMTSVRSLIAIAFSTPLLLAEARRLPVHRHQALNLNMARQDAPPAVSASATSGVLTVITPSPGASPVQVTKQSQLVTTYVPQFTLCELPPVGFYPLTPQPSAMPTTAPYLNYSMSVPPGNGSCTTIYSETETMVCATTLSDLTTTYTVTQCPQDITFSTRFGYTLAAPNGSNGTAAATGTRMYPYGNATAMITPAPTIQTLTTYYLAPWQELTSAGPPADVDLKVCSALANGTEQCVREYEYWTTSLITSVATAYSAYNFTTSIGGPSQFIVETFVANVTELFTTISMSTTMAVSYETEIETTSTSTRSVSTGPTVTQTISLEEA